MTSSEQKRIESWFLSAARDAGVPIPRGELAGEEPDFRFETESGALGLELTEVLRPRCSNHGIMPVEEESFHQYIIEAAQRHYYTEPGAYPAHVSVYFADARGARRNRHELARALSHFVRAKFHCADPIASFRRGDTPDGFDSVVIVAEPSPSDWWSGEVGGVKLADIRPQVEARIAAKDGLVSTYRSNLTDGAELWLLLYTSVTVARSIPIPHDAATWRIPFQFDRVFWFASLECQFVELQKT